MKHVLNHKWRWLTFLILITGATILSAFSFSNASAKQQRRAAQGTVANRTAIYVSGDTVAPASADASSATAAITFSTALELVRPPVIAIPGGVVSLKDQDLEPEI